MVIIPALFLSAIDVLRGDQIYDHGDSRDGHGLGED